MIDLIRRTALGRLVSFVLITGLFAGPKVLWPVDSEREQALARHKKILNLAESKCGTEAQITVRLNRGGAISGICLFLHVGYITIKTADAYYSVAIEGDITELTEAAVGTDKTIPPPQHIGVFEVKRFESKHAIGIRFIDLNLLEDPFKFGKFALNYEYRFWFLSLFLEGGADFKAGVAQNGKKYDGMAQLRWLFSKAFDTGYVGLFLNYQNGITVQKDADSQRFDVEISAYGFGALFGKKWVFGNGLFLDLTMRAGPYFETILSRPVNYRYHVGDEVIGIAYRSLGGIALTFAAGYVF